MPRAQDLISSAYRKFIIELPALDKLKLVIRLELRGRGDVQVFRVRTPGPEITKVDPDDARLEVSMPRSHFNELAEDGDLATGATRSSMATLKVGGDPDVIKLLGTVIDKHMARDPVQAGPLSGRRFGCGYDRRRSSQQRLETEGEPTMTKPRTIAALASRCSPAPWSPPAAAASKSDYAQQVARRSCSRSGASCSRSGPGSARQATSRAWSTRSTPSRIETRRRRLRARLDRRAGWGRAGQRRSRRRDQRLRRRARAR